MQALVCNEYWKGESNTTIMTDFSLTQEQLDYFLAKCGNTPLDPKKQEGICAGVALNLTTSTIAILVGVSEETVLEGIENCDEGNPNLHWIFELGTLNGLKLLLLYV